VIHFQPSEVRSIAEIPLYEDRLAAEAKVPVYNGATLWVTDRDLSQTTDYRGLSEVTVSKVADRLGIPICKYAQGTTDSVFERQRDWGDAQIIIDRANIPEMARRIVVLARGFDDVSKALKLLLGGSAKKLRTPAAVMAGVLGRPGESDRIALYASGDQKMVSEILPFRHLDAEQRKLCCRRQDDVLVQRKASISSQTGRRGRNGIALAL
jgi:hypothetical protein